MRLKLISVVGFLLMVAALLLLLKDNCLFGGNVFGVAVQVLAVCLMIWARVVFGKRSFHAVGNTTKGELVTSGPYRYVRHPIYAAALYFIWAGVLTHLTILTAALGACAIVGAGMRTFVEERFLRQQYPEYAEYANRTRRLIPFLV
jgi:protein-S-isoprenylcysteine O-methyltransferase Ste14